jgi:hypothetical protein
MYGAWGMSDGQPRKIVKAYGEVFKGQDLDVSGATILNCVFDDCRITLDRKAVSGSNIFQGCTFTVPSGDVWDWLTPALPRGF